MKAGRDAGDAIIVEQEGVKAFEEWKIFQFSNFVIRQIDDVELILSLEGEIIAEGSREMFIPEWHLNFRLLEFC